MMRGPSCLSRRASLVVARGAKRGHRWEASSIAQRPVSSYLQRIVGAFASKSKKNPFLENHRFLFPTTSIDGDGNGDGANDPAKEADKYTSSSALASNLDFSFVRSSGASRIRLLKDADRAIRATRADQLRELLRRVDEDENSRGGDPNEFNDHDKPLLQILQQWNLVEAPGAALHSVAAWMHLMDLTDAAALAREDDTDENEHEEEEDVDLTDKLLNRIQQNYIIDNVPAAQSRPSNVASRDEIRRAFACLVRTHRNHTGFGLQPAERRAQYRQLMKQQRAIERQLGELVKAYQRGSSSSPPPDVKRMVSTMYGYLHLKQQQAEILGYDSLLSQVFDSKDGGAGMAAASLDQVRALLGAVSRRLEPHLRQLAQRHEISSAATSGYLSPSGGSGSHSNNPGGAGRPPSPSETDSRPIRPMRWEKHVTLDGALKFATTIALDLFGLSIVEEPQAAPGLRNRVWDASVRLFHVHHSATSQYLGSFYLDALARPSKAPMTFATVLYPPAAAATPRTSPVVLGVSLNIGPPAWDTDPVRLRWDDILSLLHELGHVLDFFLLFHSPKERMSLGTIAGFSSLPFHRSEILSKVWWNRRPMSARTCRPHWPGLFWHALTHCRVPLNKKTVHGALDDRPSFDARAARLIGNHHSVLGRRDRSVGAGELEHEAPRARAARVLRRVGTAAFLARAEPEAGFDPGPAAGAGAQVHPIRRSGFAVERSGPPRGRPARSNERPSYFVLPVRARRRRFGQPVPERAAAAPRPPPPPRANRRGSVVGGTRGAASNYLRRDHTASR
jgi:Peptidase family M3